jgi:hypothetical protein
MLRLRIRPRAPRHFCSSAATGTAAGLPAANVELRRELWSDRTCSRLARRARPSSGVLGGISGDAGQTRRGADGLPRACGDTSGGGGGGGASAIATVAAGGGGGGGEGTLSRGREETDWRGRVAGDMDERRGRETTCCLRTATSSVAKYSTWYSACRPATATSCCRPAADSASCGGAALSGGPRASAAGWAADDISGISGTISAARSCARVHRAWSDQEAVRSATLGRHKSTATASCRHPSDGGVAPLGARGSPRASGAPGRWSGGWPQGLLRARARALCPPLPRLWVGVQQRAMAALATDEQLELTRVRARRERCTVEVATTDARHDHADVVAGERPGGGEDAGVRASRTRGRR